MRYGLAAFLVLVALICTHTGLFTGFSRIFYDQFIRFYTQPPAEDIVIVAIDQHSLDQLGRWPWPRRLHAELLHNIAACKPKVITYDIIFAEPDAEGASDDVLAASIAENSPVVLPVLVEKPKLAPLRETLPLAKFCAVAAGLGHVDTELDSDGIARSAFLKAGLGKASWPTLALATLLVSGNGIADAALPGERNPQQTGMDSGFWVRDYRVLVPFSGPADHFQQVSFTDVLSGNFRPSSFKDKYVLVGATATGLGDTVPTPVSALGRPIPGVEFNAHILDGFLRGRLIEPAANSTVFLINICIALLCALPFIIPGVNGLLLWALVLAAGTLLTSWFGLTLLHIWFPPGTALFIILLGFLVYNGQHIKRLLSTLFEERFQTQATLTSISDAVIRIDEAGKVRQINHAAETLCDVSSERAMGKPIEEILHLHTRKGKEPYPLRQLVKEMVYHHREPLILSNKKSKEMLVQVATTPIPPVEGQQGGAIIVLTDISEAERLAGVVQHSETHNSLTGLPNLILISEKLQEAIDRAQLYQRLIVVVDIDIDHFAKINKSMGNVTGDLLLKTVAERLQTLQLQGTIRGHVGADEFVLIIENVQSGKEVMALVDHVRQALGSTVSLFEKKVCLSFTLGISVYPENGRQPNILLHRANAAMHRGKEQGQGKTVQYTDSLQTRAERLFHVEQVIQEAVETAHVETLYQPLVQASNLQIMGVEALMRLRDDTGEYVNPVEFIALAEESGKIVNLGNYQLYDACRALASWQEEGRQELRLSYNLSPRQLQDPDLVYNIQQTLDVSGFPPHLLEFEITENLFLKNNAEIKTIIDQLRKLGPNFAIDDFGTGYSSMRYLTQFPFHRLKIDRSLVLDLASKPGARAITSAIISMAHSLDMQVVAEGVEMQSQLEILLSQGCDEVQGFFIDRPMKADQLKKRYLQHL
ncbi:MAG: EAL domain-containing protein [Proteobacteria bacterium]|nr:EAL domain-containing protein [Pseudomonadota bacterium]